MEEDKERRVADKIIDHFEALLKENDLKIPSNLRTGREGEACIFGLEYFKLGNEIKGLLKTEYVMDAQHSEVVDKLVWLNIERRKRVACAVIDLFEDLLDEHDIDIPSADREGTPDEAHIYGSEYYGLEDNIVALLLTEYEGE